MAAEFKQKISLEGAEEIRRQLEELGEAGKEALDRFNKTVTQSEPPLARLQQGVRATTTTFGQLTQAATTLNGALGPLGNQATALGAIFGGFRGGAGLAAGATVAAGAVVGLAKSTADSTVQMKSQAEAIGLTTRQLQVLTETAKSAGIDTNQLTGALTRFSGQVEGEAKEQFKALVDIAKQLGDGLSSITQAAPGPGFAKDAFGWTTIAAEDLKKLQDAAAQVAPQLKEMFRQAGDPRAALTVEQLRDQIVLLAQGSGEASVKMRELLRAAAAPAPAFNQLEKLDDLLTKNSGSLTDFGIKLLDAKLKGRPLAEVLVDTLDKLNDMPAGFEKTAQSARLFGRAAGPELVQALSRGGIQAAINKLREAGLIIDDELIQKAIEGKKAFAEFSRSSSDLGQNLGRLVLPSVTDFFKEMNEVFSGKRPLLTFRGADVFKEIMDSFKELQPGFADIATKAQAVWTAVKNSAINAFKGLGDLLAPALGDLWETLRTDASSAWADISSGAGRAFTAVSSAATNAFNFIKPLFRADFWSAMWTDLKSKAGQAWDFIVEQAQAMPGRISAALSGLGVGLWESLKQGAQSAWDFIVQGAQAIPAGISAAFGTIGTELWELIKAGAQAAWDFIVEGAANLPSQVSSALSGLAEVIAAPFRIAATIITSIFEGLLGIIRRVIEGAANARSAASGSTGGNIPGMPEAPFARGGFVRGRGTATSDSIFARLSRGEFVIRAAAVRHWGTDFFAALNALRTPRFDMGGLVAGLNRTMARNFAVPGFAMGGPAIGSTQRGDLRPVIINIGGRQVAGLFAPPDVVQELRRAAISEQYLSAGRKTI